ncbi:MAG: ATP-binding protein, partial [Limisphaerales bacterium]
MEIELSGAIELLLPSPSLVQVFFEAIANSLDAGASEVFIRIEIKKFRPPEGFKISITDNGQGFNDESFYRFEKLTRKKDELHMGLGRLAFVNYFKEILVESIWGANRRSFIYSEKDDWKKSNKIEKLDSEKPNATTLTFTGFKGERIKAHDDIKPSALKSKIIEQFLPKLLKRKRENQNLTIKIDLQVEESSTQGELISGEEKITLGDVPQLETSYIKDPLLDAYDGIEMLYQVKEGLGERNFLVAASIGDRTITINKLLQPASVPLNHSVIFIFSSKLFRADTSRQKIILSEGIADIDLNRILRREIGKILTEQIPQLAERNTQTKGQLEKQFPHLLGLFEESTVGIIDKNAAIDIAQHKFFKAEKEILQCENLDDAAYEKSLELSSRTLTEYILYREKIIRKMRAMTPDNSEEEIHELIVPR